MEPVKSVLYVGNSYFSFNNGIGWHVRHLHSSSGAKERLRSTSITITGGGLSWHDVESYFRPDAVGSYSFNEDNTIVFNAAERLFDIVLMMDCSQCPVHPVLKTSFREFARKHSETVRRRGAKPAFFMSWAYRTAPEMTPQLAEAYNAVGSENDALVVPAGLAFAKALARQPTVGLYMADDAHPTLQGTYLSAATVYGSLFGRSPVGLPYDAGLREEEAAFLQAVAWETVLEHRSRG
jgi:hypothetical protein